MTRLNQDLGDLESEVDESRSQFQLESNIAIKPRSAGCRVPLTAFQLFAWRSYIKLEQPLNVRMCAAALRVVGRLDAVLLAESIAVVVQRHESLRTRIVETDGVPFQKIDREPQCRVQIENLATASRSSVEAVLSQCTKEFMEQRVDLSVGPLFEAKLWRLSAQEHILILVLDHMVGDGISNVILTREIWELYSQGSQGMPVFLPAISVQFADYAVWQQRNFAIWREKHETYWKDRLAKLPRVQIPTDDGLTKLSHPIVAARHFGFGSSLSAKLRSIAKQEQMELPTVILATYVVTMSWWCNQEHMDIFFALHGRHNRPELRHMVGLLATGITLPVNVAKESTLIDVVRQLHVEFSTAFENRDYFLVPETFPELIREPMFNWLPAHTTRRPERRAQIANGDIRLRPYTLKRFPGIPKNFYPFFYDGASGVACTIYYRPDLFWPSTIACVEHNLRLVADELAQRPLSRVVSMPMRRKLN